MYEGSPEPTPEPPQIGLVAEYLFNGDCTDSSGNDHDASGINVTYVPDRHGTPGAAAYFNGTNAYVITPVCWDYPTSFTICAWTNIEAFNDEDMIMGNCPDTDSWNGFWAEFSYDYHRFYNYEDIINVLSGYQACEWHHVVYVYDNVSRTLTLYSDGSYFTSATMVYSNYSGVSTNYIGSIGSGMIDTYLFNGLIDDVLIYDQPLTSTEVADLYSSQAPK